MAWQGLAGPMGFHMGGTKFLKIPIGTMGMGIGSDLIKVPWALSRSTAEASR
jgi:hypothetical protein